MKGDQICDDRHKGRRFLRHAGRRVSPLYPPGHAPATHNAMQNYDFVHTLQIDQMIGIKRESYRGIPDLRIERFFSCDPAVLRYRADVIWEFAESEPLQELCRKPCR